MKLLIDACLSPRVIPLIRDLFSECTHVFDCGNIAKDDQLIWDFAKSNSFAILTKDSDFMHRSDLHGAPPKIIWLRVGNARTRVIADLICRQAGNFLIFEADPFAALLIVDL